MYGGHFFREIHTNQSTLTKGVKSEGCFFESPYLFVTTQQMTPMLRFMVIYERNYTLSMGMSFFTMPSQR
jgi:hypothetical protein